MPGLPVNCSREIHKVEAMIDEEIDTSDILPLDEAFFANAKLRLPKGKVPVVISVDADVMAWFKAQGEEYHLIWATAWPPGCPILI